MRFTTTTILSLLVVGLCGCNTGSRSKTTSSTTASTTSGTGTTPIGSGTAPTTSTSQVTWEAFFAATPATQGDSISALLPLASGDLLAGHAAGPIDLVDAQGVGTNEGTFGSILGFADIGGRVFAGTSESAASGRALERTAGGWTTSLTHPNMSKVIVAGLNQDVYAFGCLEIAGVSPDATVSVLPAGTTQWVLDQSTIPNAQFNDAVVWNGELWAGGSEVPANGTGGPKLVHGSGTTWTDAAMTFTAANNQLEIISDLEEGSAQQLVISSVTLDTLTTPPTVLGGRVVVYDGTTFSDLLTMQNDAPSSLAWHQGELFVGTLAGRLLRHDGTQASQEMGLPANSGVISLLSQDANTLLLGIRGMNGAEVFRRLGAPAQQQPPQQQPPASPTYVADVKPVLQAKCALCHATPTNAAFAAYPLSANLADDQADYTETHQRTTAATPEASPLVRKAIGLDAHQGGAPIQQGSADYDTLVDWVKGGVPFN